MMSRALALGVPSGFFDHFSMKWAFRMRPGGASDSVPNSQTEFVKNEPNSFRFASMNASLSARLRARSFSVLASFCLFSFGPP